MNKLFLIFNHTRTKEQIEDAKKSLYVDAFLPLPEALQTVWSTIPPYETDIKPALRPIKDFLAYNGDNGDFALIQGDFGSCYELVNFCKSIGITPVYATNTRVSTEELKDGVVHKVSEFKHCIFRKY